MLSRRSTTVSIFHGIDPDEIKALLKKAPQIEDKNFISKLRHDPVYRWKFFRTFWIWWSFLVFGWIYAQVGPTLPDLQLLLDIGLQTASWLFTSFSFGYMIGCLVYGILDGKANMTLLLALCQFGAAVFTAAVPWCPNFWSMLLMRILMGVCLGGLDSGSHAELFSIWRVNTASYVQVMYFNFGFGGLLAPLATQKFMAEEANSLNMTLINPASTIKPSNLLELYGRASFMNTSTDWLQEKAQNTDLMSSHVDFLLNNVTNASFITRYAEPETHIQWAFLISGVLAFTAGSGYLSSYIGSKWHADEEAAINVVGADIHKHPSRPVFLFVMVILVLLLLLITGWIDTYAGFLTTFCIRELGWTKDEGVLATSVFWIAFCAANFITIFLLQLFSTETLLFSYLVLGLAAFFTLLMSSVYKVTALAWVSVCLEGGAMSIMWPLIFAWTEETVTEISRRLSSLFLVAGGVGLMVNPLILGYLMDNVSEIWFVYLLMGEGFIIFVAFTLIAVIYRQLPPPDSKVNFAQVNQNEYGSASYSAVEEEDDQKAKLLNATRRSAP